MNKVQGSYATGLGIDLSPAGTLEPRSDVASCNSTLLDATFPSPFETAATPSEISGSSSLLTSDLLTREYEDTSSSLPKAYVHVPDKPSSSETFYKVNRLTTDTNPEWRRSEINTVLGDANSRLKPGVKLLPRAPEERKGLALEKARRRSRVDLDIFLKNDMCVQDGHLQGLVKIYVRKHSKKRQPILLADSKLSIIGFESNANEKKRHVFYENSTALSDVASNIDVLYHSEPDSEGFTRSKEGIHLLPFSFYISASEEYGTPKGHTHTLPGLSVRYIAMVSLSIKDPISGKKSMAHFYRYCSIWPRLNPSVLLAPTSRPLQVTVSEGLVFLTASLHRLHWVAGQLCYVRLEVINNSKKTLRNLSLELIQSATTFNHRNDDEQADIEANVGSSTTKRHTAQSSLVMGETGTRGHASARGWWSGIAAGDTQTFSHSILLPADALSVSRGKLLEISYAVQVTVSTGTFLPADVHVSLPLEIINFLSIDPPPGHITETGIKKVAVGPESGGLISTSLSTCETMDNDDTSSNSVELDDEYTSDEDENDSPGYLSVHEDTAEAVQQIIQSATVNAENAPRFADLYFSSMEQNLNRASGSESPCQSTQEMLPQTTSNFASRVEEKNMKRKTTLLESRVPLQTSEFSVGEGRSQTALYSSNGQPGQDFSISTNDGQFRSGLSTLLGGQATELSSLDSRPAKGSGLWDLECQPGSSVSMSRSGDVRGGDVQAGVTLILAARARLKPVAGAVDISAENCNVDATNSKSAQPIQDRISLAPPKFDADKLSALHEVSLGDIIDAYIEPSSSKDPQNRCLPPLPETTSLSHQTPSCMQTPEELDLVKGTARTSPIRRLSVDLILHSAPPGGSVRDKIRELEELTAKAGVDT